MMQWELTAKAEDDLDVIYDYSFNKWGLTQAEKYIREIHQKIQTIAAEPNLGRRIDIVKKGYRKVHINRHFILYKQTHPKIIIIRILHEKMDLRRHV